MPVGRYGLPPATREGLMTCDQYSAYARPCDRNGERKDTLFIQYGFLS